MTIVLQICN